MAVNKVQLEREDHERDAAFKQAMHGKTAAQDAGFMAMLKKNKEGQQMAVDEYFKFWDGKGAGQETDADMKERVESYATLTRHYYNLATDLYENGWGQSFHFCRFYPGEGFYQAIARHEHFLAHMMGLKEGMTVLDVGCGVGGPAREMTRFAGVNIVGLNNNDYQIERATNYAIKAGLQDKQKFVKGDFMQMSFEPNSFDAVYAIEATVHAPSLEGVYSEIFKVLKPGGVFGVYEWLMTDDYDPNNAKHREICHGIEIGDGISQMVKISEGLRAIKAAGFELEYHEDLAQRPDVIPWYYPLAGDLKHVRSLSDLFTVFRMTKLGRSAVHKFVGGLEMLGVAPKGTQKTADTLAVAADCLVAGAKENLFTPMYMMIARKPLNA
ncbi:S-adenosyl-L-methionine-dependent methyltransferase [Pyronema domesticum]|uniref:Sterol 24-C-methyltransferase n=1 Tax=Pyronema omphalodes (strain CBS 100304) TaxID=1076935 RepID=U4KVC9_PYROM|nr:S-adenosyl-L-methionine-dependent methyltransferase [Pyronema domesticum]CCX05212.1 Similar to Sterol 24-C-methyltransferase; acc. no. Q9P3R1 [Pyronema omphalodes CBS 100304]